MLFSTVFAMYSPPPYSTKPTAPPMMSQPRQFALQFQKKSSNELYKFNPEYTPPQFQTKVLKQRFRNRLQVLVKAVNENHLHSFYSEQMIIDVASRLMSVSFKNIQKKLGLRSKADAYRLAPLALYDIHVLPDNSGSMNHGDSRMRNLKYAMKNLFYLSSQFDEDGADYHWLHCTDSHRGICKNVKTSKEFDAMMRVEYNGGTPTAEILRDHIIAPIFDGFEILKKPVLVYIITDGSPVFDNDIVLGQIQVDKVLMDAFALKDSRNLVQNAIEYTFIQVGNDDKATDWLQTIDDMPILKDNIDCVSDYEVERRQTGVNEFKMTLGDWFLKLAIGAIDDSMDRTDTKQLTVNEKQNLVLKTQQVAEYLLYFRTVKQQIVKLFVVSDVQTFEHVFYTFIASHMYLTYGQWSTTQEAVYRQ